MTKYSMWEYKYYFLLFLEILIDFYTFIRPAMNRGNRAGGLKFLMPTSLPTSGQSQVLLQLHPLFSFFQPLQARIPLAAERTAALFHRQAHVLSKLPEEPL